MIQMVCISWGTAYSECYINGLYRAAVENCSEEIRFVCITDKKGGKFDYGIEIKPFPDIDPGFLVGRAACLAKLCMFAKGILQPGIETFYIDLDTMLVGDLSILAAKLRRTRGLYLVKNHLVPTWRLPRVLRSFFPERYYFGNSSVVGYYPEDYYFLFDLFREKIPFYTDQLEEGKYSKLEKKLFGNDERFISYFARHNLRAYTSAEVARFSRSYMVPWFPSLEKLARRLPWIGNRRQRAIAVTFDGSYAKPETVVNFHGGELLKHKYLRVRWDFQEFSDYWKKILKQH